MEIVHTKINGKIPFDYVPFPHNLYARILQLELTKRQLNAVLLIIRLTYGINISTKSRYWIKNDWAQFESKSQFLAAGIDPKKVNEVIYPLIKKKIINHDKDLGYQLNETAIKTLVLEKNQTERLKRLIHINLKSRYSKLSKKGGNNINNAVNLSTNYSPNRGKPSRYTSQKNPVERSFSNEPIHIKEILKKNLKRNIVYSKNKLID